MDQPRFALTGAAGFVAPRHLQAIKNIGGELVAAYDTHDAVGILDKFDFDTEFYLTERSFEDRIRQHDIDWLAICSPNNAHVLQTQIGFNAGLNVICEKPLALYPSGLDSLAVAEQRTGKRVYTILQLRHHSAIIAARKAFMKGPRRQVSLTYVTPRGRWYARSWKADMMRSGGLVTNIGIHMLDALLWIFGACDHAKVTLKTRVTAKGELILDRADVTWMLSTDPSGPATRELTVDGTKMDFTTGFDALHTKVYEETLAGRGHGIEDARPAVELAARLR